MYRNQSLFTKLVLLSYLIATPTLWAVEQVSVAVKANGQHEECFYLETSTKVSYIFKASKPLDFNFHYHDNNGMNYIKDIKDTTSEDHSLVDLTPKQVYCLMWNNRSNEAVSMNYQFSKE